MRGITLYGDEALRFKLRKVRSRLDETGVCWAVFAGAAAHCYGSKRKVTDIDILVNGTHLEKAKAFLMGIEGVDVVTDLKMDAYAETCLFFMDDEMEKKNSAWETFGCRNSSHTC